MNGRRGVPPPPLCPFPPTACSLGQGDGHPLVRLVAALNMNAWVAMPSAMARIEKPLTYVALGVVRMRMPPLHALMCFTGLWCCVQNCYLNYSLEPHTLPYEVDLNQSPPPGTQ